VFSVLARTQTQNLVDKIRRYEFDLDTAKSISRGEALLKAIPTSRWREFEVLGAQLLGSKGWDTDVTPATGDQGLDFIGTKPNGSIAVGQAKHQSSSVSQPTVQAAVGAAVGEGAELLIVASSSDFTRQAKNWVTQVKSAINIELWNREKIVEMIDEKNDEEFDELVRAVVSSPTRKKISNIVELRTSLTELEVQIQSAVISKFGRLPQCWVHDEQMIPRLDGQYRPDIKWMCEHTLCPRGRNSKGEQLIPSRRNRRYGN